MAGNNSTKLYHAVKDETGNVYGRLTVLEFAGIHNTEARWLCRCDCGKLATVTGSDMRKGGTKSCGCLRSSQAGGCKRPEYVSWVAMKNRCYNSRDRKYPTYGNRGITICEHWRTSFVNFFGDMGPKPSPRHSIERIDNDGNYSCGHCEECLRNDWPANCCWATALEQANNRSNNRYITYDGVTRTVAQWARKLGIPYPVLYWRIRRGWSEDRIFTPRECHQSITNS